MVNRNDRRNTLGGKDSNPKREELENNIIKPSGEINPLVEWNIHDSRKKEEPTNKKDEENKDEEKVYTQFVNTSIFKFYQYGLCY